MKPKDILLAAVRQAVANGYQDPGVEMSIGFYMDGTNYYSIIFDKKFADALWKVNGPMDNPSYFRTEMLHSEEPLKYLEKHLK